MSGSPYRSGSTSSAPPAPAPPGAQDRELVPVFLGFWAVSLLRVAAAVQQKEVFGVEPTLALMAVLGVPGLLWSCGGRRPQA